MGKTKEEKRLRIKRRIRKRIFGTALKPRFTVYRSNKEIYAQLVNDDNAETILYCSTQEKGFSKNGTKISQAKSVGGMLAKKALSKGITDCCFDRNGYIYHGRVKAVAEGAREEGLKF